MFTVKIKGLKKFAQILKKVPANLERQFSDEFTKFAIEYRNNVIRAMQTTPRSTRQYKRGTKTHRPSAPGYPPAIDSGNLISRMGVERARDGATFFIKGAPYAPYLEYGTKKMKPRPVYEMMLEKMEPDLEMSIMKVIRGAL